MTRSVGIAPVHKTIRVKASQAHAFAVFTAGLGRWWPRTATIGARPLKIVVMETRLGGCWYEESEDGSQANVGKILVWEPPHKFVVSWDINSNWKPARRSKSDSSRRVRMPRSLSWNIATSSVWARKPAR